MLIDVIGRDVSSAIKAATDRPFEQKNRQQQVCQHLYSDPGDAEIRLSNLERDVASALRQVENLKSNRDLALRAVGIGVVTALVPALKVAVLAVKTLRSIARAGSRNQPISINLFTLIRL